MKQQRWFRWFKIGVGYLTRMPLLPKNRWFNMFLHVYRGPDDRTYGLHDHPWNSLSIRLWGSYLTEHHDPFPDHHSNGFGRRVLPRIVRRGPREAHAIATGDWPVVTLFITGPKKNGGRWGFYTQHGYIPHEQMPSYLRYVRQELRDKTLD